LIEISLGAEAMGIVKYALFGKKLHDAKQSIMPSWQIIG
jgi:hypothetical protein